MHSTLHIYIPFIYLQSIYERESMSKAPHAYDMYISLNGLVTLHFETPWYIPANDNMSLKRSLHPW